ncbi:hypothetical protein [Paenibacillus sp. HB172176]|uniref:hypothetical protein n=1 Tax=Paenibacillus sp. HB172176 TaxID=2493690 RepID=UPI00143BC1D4|nr:hypothetical protein [Paenibacillus sp. HB172176]
METYLSETPEEPQGLKHGKLGIASFVIALIAVLMMIAAGILAAIFASDISSNDSFIEELKSISEDYEAGDKSTIEDRLNSDEQLKDALVYIVVAAIIIFASVGLAFIGLILGIVGVVVKDVRKLFGVIGVVLNGLIVLGTVGLFVFGLIVASFSA